MPTIVLLHGGGWADAYNSYAHTRRRGAEMMRFADAFAERGYLVALVDYRQSMLQYASIYPIMLLWYLHWFHCAQRYEVDDVRPFSWPAPATWAPDSGKPGPPSECDNSSVVDFNSTNGNLFDNRVTTALSDAVDDTQAAVSWLHDDTGGVLGANSIAAGDIFLVGGSAGAFTALHTAFDGGTTNVEGVVSMAGSSFVDGVELAPSTPDLVDGPPIQLQQYEYDFVYEYDTDQYTSGTFDAARQAFGVIRDEEYSTDDHQIDFRGRCGLGHVPDSRTVQQFDHAVGEADAFLDSLSGAGIETHFWYGNSTSSPYFVKDQGMDMVEDQTASFQERVGDFNGDGNSDIFWYGSGNNGNDDAGDDCDSVWYGQNNVPTNGSLDRRGTFSRVEFDDLLSSGVLTDFSPLISNVNASPLTPAEQAAPEAIGVGDFDGDGKDDLLWFQSGETDEAVWYGEDDLFDGSDDPNDKNEAAEGAFDRHVLSSTEEQDGTYDKIAIGDFNCDSVDDVYFDETGSGSDIVYYGVYDGRGDFTPGAAQSSDPSGDRDLLVADFDNDGCDDIFFASASLSFDMVWYGKDDETFDNDYYTDVTIGFETATIGNFNADSYPDVFFQDQGSTTDKIWYGNGHDSFVSLTVSALPNVAYTVAPGSFDGDSYDDLMLYDSGGNEYLLRGESGTSSGFVEVDLGALVGANRVPLVGEFGEAPGATDTNSDILWHYSASRADLGPGGCWRWQTC